VGAYYFYIYLVGDTGSIATLLRCGTLPHTARLFSLVTCAICATAELGFFLIIIAAGDVKKTTLFSPHFSHLSQPPSFLYF
jgi:hypothetical protein